MINAGTVMALDDVDVAHLGHLLDVLHTLTRLHLAAAQSAHAPEGIALDEVDALNPIRFIVDERADLIALGLVARDGRVRPLAGWHLSAVQARLRQATTTERGDPAH